MIKVPVPLMKAQMPPNPLDPFLFAFPSLSHSPIELKNLPRLLLRIGLQITRTIFQNPFFIFETTYSFKSEALSAKKFLPNISAIRTSLTMSG